MNEFERKLYLLIVEASGTGLFNGIVSLKRAALFAIRDKLLSNDILSPNEVMHRLRPSLINLEYRGYLKLEQGAAYGWRPNDLLSVLAMEL